MFSTKKKVHVNRSKLMIVPDRVECECHVKYGDKCGGDYYDINKMDC